MNTRTSQLVTILACTLLAAAAAQAQDVGQGQTFAPDDQAEMVGPPPPPPTAEQADKALLYRLTRQLRRIDRDTEEMMNKAMAEARDNDGSANPQTKARLLSLRDERDRVFSRMLILSMRHGWEIPDLDAPSVTTSSRQEAQDSVFGAIDVLVRRQFAAEARKIALQVQMPIVSLASMSD